MGWFDSGCLFDPFFFDKYEILPDGYAIEQGKILDYNSDEFYYYYDIWENFHFFGLPHGSGWIDEAPWLIRFLKAFEKAFRNFQSYEIKKANK